LLLYTLIHFYNKKGAVKYGDNRFDIVDWNITVRCVEPGVQQIQANPRGL